ncbi:MAG: DNA-protecting protein DprA [Alphaproteobacteria bacterium]|nr:DNA-protecting protein DprA [Alphaproteobacteria bacterium]
MNQPQIQSEALSQSEKLSWLRLARSENVGPITFYRLVERYGSASKALEALPELAKRGGRKKPLTAPPASEIEAEYETLTKHGGDIVTAMCTEYPLALTAIDDAPPVLSYFGDISLANKNCIAMVGARNASINGRKFAEKLAAELGAKNQIVVSGLARGIDTAAHKGALKTGTIAVVAGGVDILYPEENLDLFKEIKERGLILAESPWGQKPFAQSFPRRNRIVSGLSKACVVVEATMRSGSLITARLSGEQGRDVMAVPGHPLDPRAQGPNHLIREGATLIRNADDILEIIRSFSGNTLREPLQASPSFSTPTGTQAANDEDVPENAHETVLSNLSFTPVTVDELLRSCHLTIPVLQTVLLELEIAGRIKREAGGRICLFQEG